MKTLTLALLLVAQLPAASKYFINGGVDNNWGTAGNWASTDGGAHVAETIPSASDDVFLTSNSPNCVVNTSTNRVALSLTMTGYTGTFTMNQQLTVSGSVTFPVNPATWTIAGSAVLIINGNATLTSNGKAWPNALQFTGAAVTITFGDNWTVNGLLTLNPTSGSWNINGSTVTLGGGMRYNVAATLILGTTVVKFVGAGTIDAPTETTGSVQLPIVIDTSGTITITGKFMADLSKFQYTAGTVRTDQGAGAAWGVPVVGGGGQRAYAGGN